MGYLRGFAGMRSDLGPKGKLSLPSAAFHQAAMAALNIPPCDEPEMSARTAYVEAVEANLMRIQSVVIEDHYSKAQRGWIIVAISLIALYTLGLYHAVTISLLVLISLKTLIIQIFVRRMIVGTMIAFAAKTTDVRLPWSVPEAT
jgi:hypothetical protein